MNLLLFFAIPVATILLSIVWQRIVKSPFLVAITAFAIFLIVVYALDSGLLIFAIIYTILAFVTAYISKFICQHFGNTGFFSNLRIENIDANNISTNTLGANDVETNTLSVAGNTANGNSCNRYNYYDNYVCGRNCSNNIRRR